jgi:hypothetical protein
MDRMTIAERTRSVKILVSGLSLWQQLLTLSSVYLVFNISWFLRQFATWMIFLVSLENGMSLSPTTNTHGVFSIFSKGQGHMPLPRVKVVTSLRDEYKSVMSMSRQTNGAHGCLMSPQKVRYHLNVEQLFPRHPKRGLMLTYKHQTLCLARARIHLRF